MNTIPPDLAEELAMSIVSCGGESAACLIQLLYAVSDPQGDKHRREIAQIAMRAAIPYVPNYDELIAQYCEGLQQREIRAVSR